MPYYLTFEPEAEGKLNPFDDYTLGNPSLLPLHFGTVAPVNIFLGENNSGKSRFMRQIMKNSLLKKIEINFTHVSLNKSLESIISLIDNTNLDSLSSIRIDINGNNEKIMNILEVKFTYNIQNIVLETNKDFIHLKSLLIDLKKQIKNTKQLLDFVVLHGKYLIETITDTKNKITRAARIYSETSKNGVLAQYYDNYYKYFRSSEIIIKIESIPQDYFLTNIRDDFATEKSSLINNLISPVEVMLSQIENVIKNHSVAVKKTYIPTLRTARTLIDQSGNRLSTGNDIMQYTTITDYILKDSGVVVDTGFTLYNAIDQKRNARIEGRVDFSGFERFLSETFFNGKTVEVVAERVNDNRGGNILVTVDGDERDIHHLGDGIQAIILLLYPLFIAKEKAWFFIEEPEINLHPGFQRLFISTITTHPILKEKELTIFMTTHSNHILDFAIDDAKRINLFTFRRIKSKKNEPNYQIQLSAPRDLGHLTALGVQNSSVFLSNCTIWIEGVTDRIYIKAYLDAYLKHLLRVKNDTISLLDGLHYSFLEYAGANVAHYTFDNKEYDGIISPETLQDIKALSISNRIMLIADLDAGKKTRRDEKLTDQQNDGFVYEVLAVREIENLLSPAVIIGALQKLYPRETFDGTQLNQQRYRQSYLGKYLREQFPTLPDNFAPAKGSGTIGSAKKRPFAEAAAAVITSWDDLTPAAQKLTEKVFDFIISHNPRLGSN